MAQKINEWIDINAIGLQML